MDPMASFPPAWPNRPKLFSEVEWGPLPSEKDYDQAFKAWSLPYNTLIDEPVTGKMKESWTYPNIVLHNMDSLAWNIHERIRRFARANEPDKLETPDPDAQQRPGDGPQGWIYSDFFSDPPPDEPDQQEQRDLAVATAEYDGRAVMDAKNWTVRELLQILDPKTLPRKTLKAGLMRILAERIVAARPPPVDESFNLLPYSDLSKWGIERDGTHRIPFRRESTYTAYELYTWAIHWSPYNPAYWVARAYLFYQQGRYDLALGDAYRAFTLTEVISVVFKRANRPGLNPRIIDAIEQHVVRAGRTDRYLLHQLTKDQGVPYFAYGLRKTCHHIIALSLIGCDARYDSYRMDLHLQKRAILGEADKALFGARMRHVEKSTFEREARRAASDRWWQHEKHAGYVPGAAFEPLTRVDHPGVVELINELYIQRWGGDPEDKPCLRVEVDGQGGYRVVAKKDIPKDMIVYAEEPSIRGHWQKTKPNGAPPTPLPSYAATNPKQGPGRCENCKRAVLPAEVHSARMKWLLRQDKNAELGYCPCLVQNPSLKFCTSLTGIGPHRDIFGKSTEIGDKRKATTEDEAGGDPKRRRQEESQAPQEEDLDDLPDYESDPDADPVLVENALLPRRDGRPRRAVVVNKASSDAAAQDKAGKGDAGKTVAGKGGAGKGVAGKGGAGKGGAGKGVAGKGGAGKGVAGKEAGKKAGKNTQGGGGDGGGDGEACPSNEESEVPRPLTCLEIALQTFHHRACGREWKWLHDSIRSTRVHLLRKTAIMRTDNHGTLLCLLLREVFDMTLMAREVGGAADNPYLQAHEIDAMLPLEGGEDMKERYFPFTWAANIQVPFDILETLGVNIFKNLDFDTWSIQMAIRKLAINAVPWEPRRRHDKADPPEEAEFGEMKPEVREPALQNLYVHTAFSLFNHACNPTANAVWTWDQRQNGIPNRVIVYAKQDIKAGEEVRIMYFPDQMRWPRDMNLRLFGRPCNCSRCTAWRERAEGEPSSSSQPLSDEVVVE